MKLYEFTYTDNQNLTETEILQSLEDFLLSEATFQGWAPGYICYQCQNPKQITDGEKEYCFVVEGDILSEVQDESGEENHKDDSY